ncbi:hypothetical protein HMPREF9371_0718 [Neisseria shayeganii 871]|uniref:Uncharacterized protein n=2 Tax=Neisseria shayeganii TaxID=607712 RepID=G4CGH9_9NEIS|nr:hypothetical protein HMPREF9371_0718 [Neisseria shayeganii 871]
MALARQGYAVKIFVPLHYGTPSNMLFHRLRAFGLLLTALALFSAPAAADSLRETAHDVGQGLRHFGSHAASATDCVAQEWAAARAADRPMALDETCRQRWGQTQNVMNQAARMGHRGQDNIGDRVLKHTMGEAGLSAIQKVNDVALDAYQEAGIGVLQALGGARESVCTRQQRLEHDRGIHHHAACAADSRQDCARCIDRALY